MLRYVTISRRRDAEGSAMTRTRGRARANAVAAIALLLAAALAVAAGCGDATKTAAPQARNVIVILADDLGVADVSAYFPDRIPTPNIDRIAQGGVRFDAGYATAAMCSPSRAGLLTGRYQNRFGFEYNAGSDERVEAEGLGLDAGERTIADLLRAAGLYAGMIGKWHQGSRPQFEPTARGFEEFFGFFAGSTNYIEPDVPGVINGEAIERRDGASFWKQILRDPGRRVVNNADRYLTEEFTREAIEFLDRNADRPFFLYLAYSAPHTPLQTTRKYYDRFPQIADERLRIYAAMVSALDDGVGAVLDRLDALGLADDTLIVFLSDNGCAAYARLCDCSLRGGKLTLLEGGTRIPFLMRWPRGLPAGVVYDQPVTALDVLPTALRAVGASAGDEPSRDGVDLAPFVRGTAKGLPHETLFWRSEPLIAVRQGPWKLWESRDGAFSYLFDLSADPGERNDLAATQPDRVRLLRERFDAWNAALVAPAWDPRNIVVTACGEEFRMGF
jgi:arylsulfatase A-like enzyme